jgi:effector-binding domain-containing protein
MVFYIEEARSVNMQTQEKYEVREIAWPEKTLLTKRVTTSFEKLPHFFREAYGQLFQALQTQSLGPVEPPYAIYYQVDGARNEIDVAAAVTIREKMKELRRFQKVTIPASRALQVSYTGPYDDMRTAYEALEQYVREHQLEILLMMEQYFSDPGIEKDPSKWRTEIFFLVTPLFG